MNKLPFGLLFEEEALSPFAESPPEYDCTEEISYIVRADGKRVPFVTEAIDCMGTQTVSEVRTEETDSDPDSSFMMMGTVTVTKVQAETDDED